MTIAKKLGIAIAAAAIATASATTAFAASHEAKKTKLRIQTHFSTETLSGKMAQQFVKDVNEMSNGEIEIEMFYASSVVKSVETFDAAVNGILDCDMTGGAYQTGKNPAFQFTGDLMGGYGNPYISKCLGCYTVTVVLHSTSCTISTRWNLLAGGSLVLSR